MKVQIVHAETVDEPTPGLFSRRIYPWRTMEVGQSFIIKSHTAYEMVSRASAKYAPKEFTVRKKPTGYRVWRVR